MLEKLVKYDRFLFNEMDQRAKNLDPRFNSDTFADTPVLCRYRLPSSHGDNANVSIPLEKTEPNPSSSVNVLQSLSEEVSVNDQFEDKLTSFLRTTTIADKR